jgi:hypothetical protein
MRHVENALYDALAPIFTGRFHPMVIPKDGTYPAARYQRIGTQMINTLCGRSNLENPQYQVDIFAADMRTLLQLEEDVIDAMDDFEYPSVLVSRLDGYEEEQKMYRRILTFSIWAHEPGSYGE